MDTAQLLDDFLFAPARYLTNRGDVVGAGYLRNSFSAAANKVGAVACIGLGICAAATGDADLVTVAAAGVVGMALSGTGGIGRQPKFYLDTKPDRQLRISEDAASQLMKDRNRLPFRVVSGAALSSGVSAWLASTPQYAVIFAALGTTLLTTDAVASWWRADRTLKGHWNAIDQKPELETKPVRMPVAGMRSAPSV